jgi:hypothetical protein
MTARLSLAWTIAAGALLAFIPTGEVSESGASSDGTYARTYHQTLVQSEGRSILVLLAVPVVFAAIGAFARGRAALPARAVSAWLLGVGCLLGLLSIGLFYVPAFVLMVLSCVRAGTCRAAHPSPP